MTEKVKNILGSQYIKAVFELTIGSFIAQIITIAAAPVSTRLYTPKQLGVYTLIITLVSIFGPVICGKYDLSIVSAKDEKEAMELVAGSVLFLMLFSLAVTAGYKVYLNKNPQITEEVGGFAYLLTGILIITGFINIFTSYNNRHKEYKTIAGANIITTTVQNIGLIIFGLLKLGSIGLLLSQFSGNLSGLKKQGWHLYENKSLLKEVRFKEIKNTLIKYKRQPLFSMPAHFLNSMSYSILNFFISGLFGMEVFGYYSMSYRILGIPLSLISMNVSTVFFKKASEEKHEKGSYNDILMQITLFLTVISVFMVIILAIFGPYMFELIFGYGWHTSGIFVRILAPMYGLRFVVSALTPALIISNEQRLELMVQSLFIVCSVFSYFVSKLSGFDINAFLTLITITYSCVYIIFYIIIYRLSKKI